MQEIAKGIFVETSYPGVTLGALVLPHGTILIDAPIRPEDARSWRSALINQGSSGNRLLVNLDAHPDRTLGVRAMEATVIAHHKTGQVFRGRPSVFKGQNVEGGSEWETYSESMGLRWALPDITFSSKISLHWGPPDVILESHPGPSIGAIWAVIPASKVVFVGDSVLYNQPPFLSNADLQAWFEGLELLMSSYKDYLIVSGRSGPVPIEAVRTQYKLLKNIMKGLEKISKHDSLPDATERLVPRLLRDLEFSPHLEEQYIQRLRHGLGQYYSRRFRALDASSQLKPAEDEES